MRLCCSFAMPTSILRWGGLGHGAKEALCGEIVRIMKDADIHHRNNADVRAKIGRMLDDYRDAKAWQASSGAGTTEGGEQTIHGRRTRPSASVLFR